MDEKKPINPLDNLRGVVGDLWSSTLRMSQENTAALEELTRELQKDNGIQVPEAELPQAPERPVQARQATVEKPAVPAEPKPSFPSFESFWRTADETVDWTDALAHAHANDGLTSEHLWAFFHEHAEAVLNGDVAAYLEVLRVANPLGDLTPYGRTFSVRAESADRLNVSFEALPAYLEQSSAEVQRYLSGMALRCARDLLALLPVCEVRVEARVKGRPALVVPIDRRELQREKFTITDPVQLVKTCGGMFMEG